MLADVFDHLGALHDASLDGIFSAQLLEHLPPEQILRLIDLCTRKLKVGGVIVAETVNPSCQLALGNFYLDPTFRPVPPAMLAFMLEQASFAVGQFAFSSPVPGLGLSKDPGDPWRDSY